ncbi:serine/threonine-protein kinase pdik1l-A-like [Ptychodera flava]|uniref:serine/threonine-protein kinase pdik1l-A-like n=1 Tax=Ptychodera flava TaxID=63121 RepID=UPI003969CC69
MADAMQYSHKKGIVHRDLKPENVLISIENGKPNAKIADFGIAKIKLSDGDPLPASGVSYMHTPAGTRLYVAPEVYKSHYKEKADIFSLGLMFCAILERRIDIIRGRSRLMIYYNNIGEVCVGEYLFHHPKAVREVGKSVIIQEAIRKLINSMIRCEYKARPSAREVYDVLNSPMPIIARPEKRNDVQSAEKTWFSYCAIL